MLCDTTYYPGSPYDRPVSKNANRRNTLLRMRSNPISIFLPPSHNAIHLQDLGEVNEGKTLLDQLRSWSCSDLYDDLRPKVSQSPSSAFAILPCRISLRTMSPYECLKGLTFDFPIFDLPSFVLSPLRSSLRRLSSIPRLDDSWLSEPEDESSLSRSRLLRPCS